MLVYNQRVLLHGGQIEASGLGTDETRARHRRAARRKESRVTIVGGGVVALHGGKERRMMIGAWLLLWCFQHKSHTYPGT